MGRKLDSTTVADLGRARKVVADKDNTTIVESAASVVWLLGSPTIEAHQERINNGDTIEPSDYFVERFKLIDDYRRLLYLDPDLPEELLPVNWLRSEATDLFDQYHELLTEQANQYFDSVLEEY